ncbi:MAG: hypothetical protein ACU0E9_01290 [Limimaricola soesokkakensis]|uniref:hypothetical protein n=1 Tax=Limimaricola soesokkakensis TaxID=1343159 RepID=UPI00405871CC
MDINKGPAKPGMYLLWGAAALVALIVAWMLGEAMIDRIAPSAEPETLSAPVE